MATGGRAADANNSEETGETAPETICLRRDPQVRVIEIF